jgi:hypothetical protein
MDTPNADTNKFDLNKTLIGGNNIEQSVKGLLKHFNVTPRKNAVLAMDGLITLSPEALKSDADVKKFANEATKFLKAKFGKRCVSAVLHMDETSPHIHFTTVPIEKCPKKGFKLNARDQFSKSTLAQMQKDVFSHMHKAFPKLTPPMHGNKADHKKLKAFYNELDAEVDKIKKDMNKVLDGMIPELMSDIKKRLAQAMDNKASGEFVRTRDAIGMNAKQILDKYEANRDEIHSEAFKAIEVEGNSVLDRLKQQTEAKIEAVRAEVEKPDSKFNTKPKRKSGMKM